MGFSLSGLVSGGLGGFFGSGGNPLAALAGGAAGGFLGGDAKEASTQQFSTLSGAQQQLFNQQLIPLLTQGGAEFGGQAPGPAAQRLESLSLTGLEKIFGGEGGIFGKEQELLSGLLSPDRAGAISNFQELQTAFRSPLANAQGIGNATLERLLSGQATDFEDFFQTNVAQPLQEQFSEDIIPGLDRRFAGRFSGSERISAEEAAREDLIDSLTQSRSSLAFQTAESAANRSLTAQALLGERLSAADRNAQFAFGAGEAELGRGIQGIGLSGNLIGQLQSLLSSGGQIRDIEDEDIAQLLAAIGLNTTGTAITPATPSTLSTLLPVAGQVAGQFVGTEKGSQLLADLLT